MKLLLLGDLAGTGFGTVTLALGMEFLNLGVDLRISSMNESRNLEEPYRTAFAGRVLNSLGPNGWLRMPKNAGDHRANERAYRAMFTGWKDGWKPDVVLVTGDVASLNESDLLEYLPDVLPAFHYVPVEGIGLPPRWKAVWERLSPIAMCEFGADEIAKLGLPRPPVIYHGVSPEFHPVSEAESFTVRIDKGLAVLKSKADCRAFAGYSPEDIVIFRADRHMPRKAYPSLLRSMFPVLAAVPNTKLVMHCKTVDQGGNLHDEVSKYPEPIRARMQSTGIHDRAGGAPRSLLAILYNAADLYVSNSAEGFGLTIAESLACGVPAVGLDFSSVPEVIDEGGVVVPVGNLVDNIYSHFWAIPDERAFAKATYELVMDRERRERLGTIGALQVKRKFAWPDKARQFAEVMGLREAVAA